MKSRTLISFCQSPVRNPSHGEIAPSIVFSCDTIAVISSPSPGLSLDPRFDQPEHCCGVAGDHQFLIGWNHPRGHRAARRGDAWTTAIVRRFVQLDSKPGRCLTDTPADLGG